MARLPVLSGRDVVRALHAAGFRVVGRRGSHIRMKHPHTKRVTIVPDHAELAVGTLRAIIRQAGLDRDRFLGLL